MNEPGADDRSDDDPHEGEPEPGIGVPVVAKTLREVAVGEPESDREPDPIGVDLQRPEMEDDGYWLHGSPMSE